MTDQASQRVLISGVNGYIGYAIAIKALESGYHVIAAVRREDAIEYVLRGVTARVYHQSGALTFAVIPDMTVLDCFVQTANGCSFIIHVASPLASVKGDLYGPATRGVQALIHAAEVTPSIKRIIWTGSVVGLVPFERMLSTHPDNIAVAEGKDEQVQTITGESVASAPNSLPNEAPALARYLAGKVAATNALRDYAADHKDNTSLKFDMVILSPGWVIGPSELPKNQKEAFNGLNSNSVLMFMFTPKYRLNAGLGVPEEQHAPMIGTQVHVDDCAEAHVNAMKISFQGNMRSYLLCSDGTYGADYADAISVVRERFPVVAEKIIPNAHLGTVKLKTDASLAEKELLGRPFKSYKQMVIDTIDWYRQLPA